MLMGELKPEIGTLAYSLENAPYYLLQNLVSCHSPHHSRDYLVLRRA